MKIEVIKKRGAKDGKRWLWLTMTEPEEWTVGYNGNAHAVALEPEATEALIEFIKGLK
jgi:hypothetical protein